MISLNRYIGAIGIISILFFPSCSSETEKIDTPVQENKTKPMKTNVFDIVSMNFPESFNSELLESTELYKSWKVTDGNSTFGIQIYCSKNDTSSIKTEVSSISLYDTHLSKQKDPKEVYTIQETELGNYNARLVQGKFNSDKNYIEIYFRAICSDKIHIAISGIDISSEQLEKFKVWIKSVQINCA